MEAASRAPLEPLSDAGPEMPSAPSAAGRSPATARPEPLLPLNEGPDSDIAPLILGEPTLAPLAPLDPPTLAPPTVRASTPDPLLDPLSEPLALLEELEPLPELPVAAAAPPSPAAAPTTPAATPRVAPPTSAPVTAPVPETSALALEPLPPLAPVPAAAAPVAAAAAPAATPPPAAAPVKKAATPKAPAAASATPKSAAPVTPFPAPAAAPARAARPTLSVNTPPPAPTRAAAPAAPSAPPAQAIPAAQPNPAAAASMPTPAMDRDFIARNQIVERYISGKLPIKGATEFEKFCTDNPGLLDELGLPQRVHAGLRLLEAAGKPEPWQEAPKRFWEKPYLAIGLGVATLALLVGLAAVWNDSSAKTVRISKLEKVVAEQPLEPATSTRAIRLLPSYQGGSNTPAVIIGGGGQTQLADLKLDLSRSAFRSFRVTIDRIDQGRVAILHNIAKDSNGHVRVGLNTSALGPGNYQLTVEGLTWKGEVQPEAWITIGVAR